MGKKKKTELIEELERKREARKVFKRRFFFFFSLHNRVFVFIEKNFLLLNVNHFFFLYASTSTSSFEKNVLHCSFSILFKQNLKKES